MNTGAPPRSSALPSTSRAVEKRFDPLVHVFFALAACGCSLLIVYVTLWPGGPLKLISTPVVQAADSERAEIQADSVPSVNEPLPSRTTASHSVLEEAKTPPTLADDKGLDGLLCCTTVDESWNPIPGASIWIDDGEWHLAGHADANGQFQLHFNKESWRERFRQGGLISIGARADRHGPSLVTTFEELPDADLRLVLRGRSASLRLEVTTPEGHPVADARVAFETPLDPSVTGSTSVLVTDEKHAQPTPPPVGRTDGWGSVTFEGLEAGTRVLTVEAQGYRTRRAKFELLSGEPRVGRIELVPLADLRGVALGIGGQPLAGTTVLAFEVDGEAVFTASCDEQGHYEMIELPAVNLRLVAETRRNGLITHDARGQIRLRVGEVGEWNASLRPVEVLSGRLVDHWGQPMVGWHVELEAEDEVPRKAETDDSGRYELNAPPSLGISRLAFFHPNALDGLPTRRVELPSRERVSDVPVVELDDGEEDVNRIRGRVMRANGTPAWNSPVVLERLSDRATVRLYPDEETGRFETPAVPQGNYILRFPNLGRGWALDRRIVMEGDHTLELGTIELPETGRLRLLTSGTNRRGACVDVHVELLRPEVDDNYGLPVLVGRVELPIQFEFAPGNYRLRLPDGHDRVWYHLEIESGITTPFEVPGTE